MADQHDDWEDVDDWEDATPAAASSIQALATPTARLRAAGKTTRGDAFGRHFLQGATGKFSDEVLGGLSSILGPVAMDTPGELADRWASILNGGAGGLPGDSERPTGYKANRDAYRALNAQAAKDRPHASLAGDFTGSMLVTRKLPSGYASAMAQGAATGLGGSESEDAGGMAADAALGAGLGAAGQYVGNRVGQGTGALRKYIADKASKKLAAADELATAMATKDVNKTLQSLRGEAGGAASRAANAVSNIDDIPLPETPARTMGALRETLRGQVASLKDRISTVRAQAVAAGVNPEDLTGMRSGEFLSKGSALDKAQQMAKKIAAYQRAVDTLEGHLDDVALAADDAPALDPHEALRKAREALRNDPAFIDRQANILKNALEDAPQAVDEAEAARAAFKGAQATKAEDIAARKAQLLSPKAATARMKALAIRYGLPALGGYLGSQLGGVSGAAVGAAAGAGARPGLQALLRASKDPGVQTRLWGGVQSTVDPEWLRALLQENPRLLEEIGGAVGRSAASTMTTPERMSDAEAALLQALQQSP